MRRTSLVSLVCVALLCLPAISGAGTEEEVIKLTYAQWAAEIAKDADASSAIMATDYTEFNAAFPTRIDGKALNTTLANALAEGGGGMLAGEMTKAEAMEKWFAVRTKVYLAKLAKQLKAAVADGKLTEAQAKKKWAIVLKKIAAKKAARQKD